MLQDVLTDGPALVKRKDYSRVWQSWSGGSLVPAAPPTLLKILCELESFRPTAADEGEHSQAQGEQPPVE